MARGDRFKFFKNYLSANLSFLGVRHSFLEGHGQKSHKLNTYKCFTEYSDMLDTHLGIQRGPWYVRTNTCPTEISVMGNSRLIHLDMSNLHTDL